MGCNMDKILKYEEIIMGYLKKWADEYPSQPPIEDQLVFDTNGKHFQLQRVGWRGDRYIHSTILHFDIKSGKVWIQENRTEVEVGEDLVGLGIPKSDIVLGLQPPEFREYTAYAAA